MAHIHVIGGTGESLAHPAIRKIEFRDLIDALNRGIDDFAAMPSHAVFLCMIYPLVGFFLAGLTLGYNVLPLFFPLAAGFALIGPIAAVGLYELSRRRERGLDNHWAHAFDVLRSPACPSIVAFGLLLVAIFLAWIGCAKAIYEALFGIVPPRSIGQFLEDVFMTSTGWSLILIGNLVGLMFAVVVLAISAVSIPLMLDRDVGMAAAIATSVRAVMANPEQMAIWGLIVAGLLFAGSLPAFVGLAVVMPVLGHATWHLYRKVVLQPL